MPSLEDGARAAQQYAASTGSASDLTVLLDAPSRWLVPKASMDIGASCGQVGLTTTRAKGLSLGNVPNAPERARWARLTYMVSTPSGDNWSYGYDTLDRLTKRRGGERVRLIQLLVPPVQDGGIFDRLAYGARKVRRQSEELAKTVNDAVHQNYGLAIRKLVSAIVADSNSNKHAHAAYQWFLRKARKEVPECNLRLASKFAIVYAAGRLAHRYQLAPWTRDGLREAVFTLWRRSAEPAGDSAAAALEVVSNLEALSEDRSLITKLKKGAPLPEAAIGLHRSPANAPRQIVFVPERLAARIGRREMLAAVRYLDDQGVLIKGRGRSNKRQVRIAGLP